MSQGNLKFGKSQGKVREFYNNLSYFLNVDKYIVQLSRSMCLNSKETKI